MGFNLRQVNERLTISCALSGDYFRRLMTALYVGPMSPLPADIFLMLSCTDLKWKTDLAFMLNATIQGIS